MMCYKDVTFCDYYECKKFKTCDRAFTEKVMDDADKWWMSNGGKQGEAPVCLYCELPRCFE